MNYFRLWRSPVFLFLCFLRILSEVFIDFSLCFFCELVCFPTCKFDEENFSSVWVIKYLSELHTKNCLSSVTFSVFLFSKRLMRKVAVVHDRFARSNLPYYCLVTFCWHITSKTVVFSDLAFALLQALRGSQVVKRREKGNLILKTQRMKDGQGLGLWRRKP